MLLNKPDSTILQSLCSCLLWIHESRVVKAICLFQCLTELYCVRQRRFENCGWFGVHKRNVEQIYALHQRDPVSYIAPYPETTDKTCGCNLKTCRAIHIQCAGCAHFLCGGWVAQHMPSNVYIFPTLVWLDSRWQPTLDNSIYEILQDCCGTVLVSATIANRQSYGNNHRCNHC
jgi:hypothetical protein